VSGSSSDRDLHELWLHLEEAGPIADGCELGDVYPEDSERAYAQTARRRTFIAFYSWAVPSRSAINAIAAFAGGRSLLEVCAGSGLWSRLLAETGVKVIATDAGPPTQTYLPVLTQEAEGAVREHPECRALLLCWPPFRDGCAYRALRAFAGDRAVFAGDARFAADRQFHELLKQEWVLQESLAIPAWPGLEDQAYLFLRKRLE